MVCGMERTINEATGMTDAELGAVAVDAIHWLGATHRAVVEARDGDVLAYRKALADHEKAHAAVMALAQSWSGREII